MNRSSTFFSNKKFLIILFSITIAILITSCSSDVAKVRKSSNTYIGMNYKDVVSEFEKYGFTNISTNNIDDLTSDSEQKDGYTSKISIDNNEDFSARTKYPKDSAIIITYHSIKKIDMPISSADLKNKDSADIKKGLQAVGFTNVDIDEVEDLDPDEFKDEFKIEIIRSNNKNTFENEPIPFDEKLTILCHYPYKKYCVTINIDFIPNIIFSKYNVDIFVDDSKQLTLEHGKDTKLELNLKQGVHDFTFKENGDDSVNGSFSLDVKGDINAKYKLSCSSEKISLENIYMEDYGDVSENEILLNCSATDLNFKLFDDVKKKLNDLGFTNIQENKLYDIIWGITQEGEVKSVSINGDSNFKRGTVVPKDAEIIITYHLKFEDDPEVIAQREEDEKRIEEEIKKQKEANKTHTIHSDDELKELIHLDAQKDEARIREIVNNYRNKKIELYMITAFVEHSGDYKTRFNYLLYAVDEDNAMLSGPAFFIENVNYYDLHLTGSNVPDSFDVGLVCKVKAKVDGMSNGMIVIDPSSIEVIK